MILYEDAALVVLDKPAGLSSEEGVPAALRAHWNAPDAFVGVVHRLLSLIHISEPTRPY